MAVVSDIEIRLRADIALLQQDMNQVRRSVDSTMSSVTQAAQRARNALVGLGLGIGASEIIRLTDGYTKFTAQLKLASESTRDYAASYAAVKRIASDSQQDLQSVGTLYARIANGTRELGTTQKQVADITEAVSKALVISGATFEEAASAQLQLSQAFASGTLRGEEFNAVNEAAPRLMKALADGIGVPVGALKKMAEEGQITSDIMARVLPKALTVLREEAAQISTISGAFTVLKNNIMEFVGENAHASESVSVIAGLISTFANNLQLLAGALLTVIAVKTVNWLDSIITRTASAIRENRALAASNLAAAQATATSTAQSSLLANARLAEIRAATLAATGNIQLALTTNGLIPAQRAAAVAAAAHSTAMIGLAAAQRAASATTTAVSGVIAALGGPIGALITVLGLAATAWSVYQYKQSQANAKAAEDTEASTAEIVSSLEKQNDRLRERIRLQGIAGAQEISEQEGKVPTEALMLLEKINVLKAKGNQLTVQESLELINTQGIYDQITRTLKDNKDLKGTLEANGQAAKDLVAVRERLNGVNQQYAKDLNALQTALAKGAIGQTEYNELVSKLATETYKASDAGREQERQAKEFQANAKRQADAYASLVDSLRERAEESVREAAGLRQLNEAEKAAIDLNKQLSSGKLQLTAEQEKRVRGLIEENRVALASIESQKAYRDMQEDSSRLMKELVDARKSEIKTAKDETDRNKILAKTFGMTAEQVERLEIARLQEQLAQRSSLGLTLDEIEHLESLIALKERSAAAVADRAQLEQTKQFWEDIEKTAHDTFVSIADGGKNAFQRLKETAKNTFFDWLYQQTLKKWIINISVVGTGGIGGIAQAATGSSGGGLGSLLSVGGTVAKDGLGGLYGALTGGATLAGGLGTGFLGSLAGGLNGAGVGSGLTSALGLNIGNGIASAIGSTAASAISTGLGAVATALPWVAGPLAVYTLATKAFGHGPKQYTGESSINGMVGAGGFSGTLDSVWKKKGGWLRSDKYGTDKTAVDAALSAGLSDTYKSIISATSSYANILGVNADSIQSRSQTIKIALGKDEAENQKAIADFFSGVADTVARETLPEISKFQAAGESASATLARLAAGFQVVDGVLVALGINSQIAFNAVGTASLDARERLIAMSGGIEALASQTQFFADNFLTRAEQVAPLQRMVNEQLAELGYAGVTTADQFRLAVLNLSWSGALATEEGARTYTALMALAPAFKTVTDYLNEIKEASKEFASGRLDSLSRAVDAQKDIVTKAYQASMTELESQIDGVNDSISRTRDLSEALKGAIGTVSSPTQAYAARQAAQAQIATALAIAKASGVLPSTDDLRDALSSLGRDASDQFSTLADYQREVARTNNQLIELGGLTDDQLSVAERQLRALQDQKELSRTTSENELLRLDSLVSFQQRQLNALTGVDDRVYSVAEAVRRVEEALDALRYAPPGASVGLPTSVANPNPNLAQPSVPVVSMPQQYGTMGGSAAAMAQQTAINDRFANMEKAMNRTANAVTQLATQFDQVSAGGQALGTVPL